jgi:broad specificity phosphatase PhoE
MASFVARTSDAMEAALIEASQEDESRVVVVAHGGTVMAAMCRFADSSCGLDSYFDWYVHTCEGYIVDVRIEDTRISFGNPQRIRKVRSLPW